MAGANKTMPYTKKNRYMIPHPTRRDNASPRHVVMYNILREFNERYVESRIQMLTPWIERQRRQDLAIAANAAQSRMNPALQARIDAFYNRDNI